MTENEKELFINHMNTHLGDTYAYVMNDVNEGDITLSFLVYTPTEELPFWKMVTMGASDHEMTKEIESLPNRNEYIMFIPASVDLVHDNDELNWYYNFLFQTAIHPYVSSEYMSYAHSLELEGMEGEMVGTVLLFPQILNPEVLRCDLDENKQCACLQVMPITKEEIELKRQVGADKFVELFYPDDFDEPMLFLAEKHRTKA